MELKGSKTERNLREAFAGETQARSKYDYFASVAKKEGYEQIAAIFQATANNEKEHAKMWFKALCGGSIPDTLTCLEMAASGELSLIHTDAADDLLCVDLGGRRIIKSHETEVSYCNGPHTRISIRCSYCNELLDVISVQLN